MPLPALMLDQSRATDACQVPETPTPERQNRSGVGDLLSGVAVDESPHNHYRHFAVMHHMLGIGAQHVVGELALVVRGHHH